MELFVASIVLYVPFSEIIVLPGPHCRVEFVELLSLEQMKIQPACMLLVEDDIETRFPLAVKSALAEGIDEGA
jgi:hypothetical protein